MRIFMETFWILCLTLSCFLHRNAGSTESKTVNVKIEGSTYQLHKTADTWGNAANICKAHGGVMIKLDDAQAQLVLTSVMHLGYVSTIWIGGLAENVGWKWFDSDTNKNTDSSYMDVLSGSTEFPACLALSNSGSWSIQSCGTELGYICESAAKKRCKKNGRISFQYEDRCIDFISLTQKWYDARERCKKLVDGRLIVIDSERMFQELSKFLQKDANNDGELFWVGMANHNWKWDGGSLILHPIWNSNSPDMSGSCVALHINNTMTNQNCANRQPFVCMQLANESSPALTDSPKRKNNENKDDDANWSIFSIRNLRQLNQSLIFSFLGSLGAIVFMAIPLFATCYYYRRRIKKMKGFIDVINKPQNRAMSASTIQANEMPYPYNHIYSEARVPPLPIGRPPTCPPANMDSRPVYNGCVTQAHGVMSPTNIATFSNGVYSTEDSTIYGQTVDPRRCTVTSSYETLSVPGRDLNSSEGIYSTPLNTLPGH